jgi:hypothetical protein
MASRSQDKKNEDTFEVRDRHYHYYRIESDGTSYENVCPDHTG